MELLKSFLKNPKVVATLLGALVAGLGLLLGVQVDSVKDAYCGAPAAEAPAQK